MKRPYESVVVFDGALPDDVLQKEQQQIEEILKQNATFERTDVWGKRALAYTIKKKKTGFFCMILYEGEGNVVIALDKFIRLNDNILRHLTVVRNVKNDLARAAVAARKEKVVENDRTQNNDDREE